MPKLDLLCIKDIILTVQDLTIGKDLLISEFQNKQRLARYDKSEIIYHVKHLAENHLEVVKVGDRVHAIKDLTITGHRLIWVIESESHSIEDAWELIDVRSHRGLNGLVSIDDEVLVI